MTRKTARNLTGWEWRVGANDKKQRRRSVKYDSGWMSFTLADLRKFEEEHKLQEAEWEIDKEWEYGEEYSVLKLKGWSDATPEEIAAEVAKLNEQQDQQDERDRRLAEELLSRRPDLFKEKK